MAIKIIKKGRLPEEKQYTGICNLCGCKFKFHESDSWGREADRDSIYVSIMCPTPNCRNTVLVNVLQ